MLNQSSVKKSIAFWKKGMEDNLKTMNSLHKSKRYSACLFFGHLVLEKALKILVMKATGEYAPRTHNLHRLAEVSRLGLKREEMDFLAMINTFNMEGRYPEEKFDFYKLCDKAYVDRFLPQIKKMYKKLCQLMK